MNKIKKTIKEYQKIKDCTQAMVAREIGIDPSSLSRILSNPKRAKIETAMKFCSRYGGVFNLCLDDFV